MHLTESRLRILARQVLKELLTKKNPFSAQNVLEPGGRGGDGSIGGYYDDGYYGDYGDFGDFGDFGEADEILEDELTEDEKEVE